MTSKIAFLIGCILLINCSKRVAPSNDERIVGGYDDTIENVPYTISLSKIGFGHFCGGTLISFEWVLTAAHCLVGENSDDLYVRAGSSFKNKGGTIRKVQSVIPHERYNKEINLDFDIGLVQLKRPLPTTDNIDWIPMAKFESTPAGKECIISGWGTTKRKEAEFQLLKSAIVKIVGKNVCQQALYRKVITNNMLCAGAQEHDACQGDSGGPMICTGRLTGVVSWGEGCATVGKPGVYTSVQQLQEWITFYTGSQGRYRNKK